MRKILLFGTISTAVRAHPRRDKNFSLRKSETMYHAPISSHPEGRTRRHYAGRGCDGRKRCPAKACGVADGEGVWSCPPDAGVNLRVKSPEGRRLESPDSGESAL